MYLHICTCTSPKHFNACVGNTTIQGPFTCAFGIVLGLMGTAPILQENIDTSAQCEWTLEFSHNISEIPHIVVNYLFSI